MKIKTKLWSALFWLCFYFHQFVVWFACWTDFFQARAAFRAMGNFKFNNTRHNFARFETVQK